MPGFLAAATPFISSIIGAGSAFLSNRLSSAEAEKNRRFQERMSSTAHQREVDDLRRAGLHPMMSAKGSGASTPGGAQAQVEDIGSRASSAAMAAAQIKLTHAQTERELSQSYLARAQAGDLAATVGGRTAYTAAQTALLDADWQVKSQSIPSLIAKAKEEVQLVANSAQAAKARVLLDEAALKGALNEEEFQKAIGAYGPAVKFLIQILRDVRLKR